MHRVLSGRRLLSGLVVVGGLFAALPADAGDWACFGPEDVWCGWTVRQSQPEMGWGVVNKVRLPGLILETIIDARHNNPVLRVRVAPVPATETARVLLSIRRQPDLPATWQTFAATARVHRNDTVELTVPRQGLENVIEAPSSAQLYVFVELRSKTTNHRLSHKVGIQGLRQALRFARLGHP